MWRPAVPRDRDGTAGCSTPRHAACSYVGLTLDGARQHLALQLGVVGLEAGHPGEPDAEVAAGRLCRAPTGRRLEGTVDCAPQALPRLVAQERELRVVQPNALHAGASATRDALRICTQESHSGVDPPGCATLFPPGQAASFYALCRHLVSQLLTKSNTPKI